MDDDLRSYTQRRARIAKLLEPYLPVSRLADTTSDPNPLDVQNGLACKWADLETGRPVAAVFIRAVNDVSVAVAKHRHHVYDYALRFEDSYTPTTAREEPAGREGEFIFVFEYLGKVIVIVGQCEVSIGSDVRNLALSTLVAPALEIGRTVGCSPYENDFVPPELPEKLREWGWTAFGSQAAANRSEPDAPDQPFPD